MLEVLTCLERVFSKRAYKERKIKAYILDSNLECVTLLAYIYANKLALSLVITY
jgi:hypothetical protein